jgi:hypothetical protein
VPHPRALLISCPSSSRLRVSKAAITNLLEDEKEILELQSCAAADGVAGLDDTVLDLVFRGFQVVTLKLKVEITSDVYVSSPGAFATWTDGNDSAQIEEWIDVVKI